VSSDEKSSNNSVRGRQNERCRNGIGRQTRRQTRKGIRESASSDENAVCITGRRGHLRERRECTPNDDDAEVTICPVCESQDNDSGVMWVCCDNLSCSAWYHLECTNINPQEVDSIIWFCPNCDY
jgi:hypothetical protein